MGNKPSASDLTVVYSDVSKVKKRWSLNIKALSGSVFDRFQEGYFLIPMHANDIDGGMVDLVFEAVVDGMRSGYLGNLTAEIGNEALPSGAPLDTAYQWTGPGQVAVQVEIDRANRLKGEPTLIIRSGGNVERSASIAAAIIVAQFGIPLPEEEKSFGTRCKIGCANCCGTVCFLCKKCWRAVALHYMDIKEPVSLILLEEAVEKVLDSAGDTKEAGQIISIFERYGWNMRTASFETGSASEASAKKPISSSAIAPSDGEVKDADAVDTTEVKLESAVEETKDELSAADQRGMSFFKPRKPRNLSEYHKTCV